VPEVIGSRPGMDRRDGRRDKRQPIVAMVFFPLSEGREKYMPCGDLRGEERLSSRTRVWVDRVRVFDNMMSEGLFRLPFPLAPARPESHMSLGLGGPTRLPQANPLG
jgi:hypothetical protein